MTDSTKLPYDFDLVYDIKTMTHLEYKVRHAERFIKDIYEMMEEHGITLPDEE